MGLLATCFLLMFCLSAYGQNIQKYYVSKIETDGMIYHLLPVTLFDDEEGEDLTYDLTYTSWNDSITMTLTYLLPEPTLMDSIQLTAGKNEIGGKVEQLFVEPTAKRWIHRYRLKERADIFHGLYTQENDAVIRLLTHGKERIYKVKRKKWRKYAPIGQKIFEMIHLRQGISPKHYNPNDIKR